MLIIPGTSALSNFRINKLLAELQGIDAGILVVTARFVHFVDASAELDEKDTDLLQRLLN